MTEPTPEQVAAPTNAEVDTRSRESAATQPGSGSKPSNAPGGTPTPVPDMFGRYRILRTLGQGGMGTVYLALDTQLDRQVALKVPQFNQQSGGEGLERFFREARVMASLRHPNLCPVYDVGEIDGVYYLTMAFVDGRPLSDLFRPLWPQHDVAALFQKLARALHVAHKAGVIHRDLKPANIMIEHGEPIIMDFGLARRDIADDTTLTRSGMIVGTPAYMSPEQVAGQKIGPATDIYSLGVILYQMLAGDLPFQGSLVTVLGQIVTKAPTPLQELRADVDERLEKICSKAMAKSPADRYTDGVEMAHALASFLRGVDESSGELLVTQSFIPPKPPSTTRLPVPLTTQNRGLDTQPIDAPQPIVDPASTPEAQVDLSTIVTRTPAIAPATRRGPRRAMLISGTTIIAAVLAIGGWQFWKSTHHTPHSGSPTTGTGPAITAVTPESGISKKKNVSNSGEPTQSGDTANSDPPPPVKSLPIDPPPEPTARDKALAALQAGDYAVALELFDDLLDQPDADDADYGHRARAYRGLAEAGADRAEHFMLAAEDFGRAKLFAEQAQARFAVARELAAKADAMAKEAAAADKQLVELDEQAIAEYRAAIALADEHDVAAGADWSVELADFEARPRFAQRIAMEQAREQIQTHYAAAKGFVRQAVALAKERPADDVELEQLDQKAAAAFRAALALTEKHKEHTSAADKIQTDLTALENSPRIKARAALQKLRQELLALTRQQRESPRDPAILLRMAETERKLGLETEAQQHAALSHGLSAIQAARTGGMIADVQAVRRAIDELITAIAADPQPPEPPAADEPPTARHKALAELFAVKGSLAEDLDEAQPVLATLQLAAVSMRICIIRRPGSSLPGASG